MPADRQDVLPPAGSLTPDAARQALERYRDEIIMRDLPGSEPGRCILRDEIIEALVAGGGDNRDAFARVVPQFLRERIDSRQVRYLDDIFEIVGAIVRPDVMAGAPKGPDQLALGAAIAFRPYREARLIGDLPADLGSASARSLINPVLEIVRQEGPIHVEEIARRLNRLAGGVQAGRRIVETVAEACDLARRRGALRNDGDFWRAANGRAARPRNRADATLTLRQIEMIAPAEIREAARVVLQSAPGLDPADAVLGVARGLGYSRVSETVSRAIAAEVLKVICRTGE